jgi:hypothetical protein
MPKTETARRARMIDEDTGEDRRAAPSRFGKIAVELARPGGGEIQSGSGSGGPKSPNMAKFYDLAVGIRLAPQRDHACITSDAGPLAPGSLSCVRLRIRRHGGRPGHRKSGVAHRELVVVRARRHRLRAVAHHAIVRRDVVCLPRGLRSRSRDDRRQRAPGLRRRRLGDVRRRTERRDACRRVGTERRRPRRQLGSARRGRRISSGEWFERRSVEGQQRRGQRYRSPAAREPAGERRSGHLAWPSWQPASLTETASSSIAWR